MGAYEILVIILSTTLAIFLVLAIIASVLIIKILKQLKIATESAKHAAGNVEEFTSQLKSAGKATAVGSTIAQFINIIKKGKK